MGGNGEPRPTGAGFSVRGLARAAALGIGALVLAAGLYVALVQLDVVRSPLDPSLRGDVEAAASDREGIRVLFVGNSFTFENDLPALVADLAAGQPGGPALFIASYAAPGWSLRAASEDDGLSELLREIRWDVVVLQEASRLPSRPASVRSTQMHPYASALAREIRSAGARPALFMTWGYRDGDDRASETDTFSAMQARVAQGYEDEGSALAAPVVPVGLAWATAAEERPGLELWDSDGKHPSRLGSYLAACAFYVALTGADASDTDVPGGLAADDATFLQRVATDVITAAGVRGTLADPGRSAVSR